jgi:hypothetical protein
MVLRVLHKKSLYSNWGFSLAKTQKFFSGLIMFYTQNQPTLRQTRNSFKVPAIVLSLLSALTILSQSNPSFAQAQYQPRNPNNHQFPELLQPFPNFVPEPPQFLRQSTYDEQFNGCEPKYVDRKQVPCWLEKATREMASQNGSLDIQSIFRLINSNQGKITTKMVYFAILTENNRRENSLYFTDTNTYSNPYQNVGAVTPELLRSILGLSLEEVSR